MASNLALLLEQIIASPLKAIVDAQSESANATVDFLLSLMDMDGERTIPKSVQVVYNQTYLDPESGELKQEAQKLSIPLVTLVPIPYISVDEADIEFKAKIVAAKPVAGRKAVPLYAVYASKQTSKVDVSGDLHIRIKAKRADVPEGIARMITALSNSLNITGEE
ncbi:MAG: DUF2589 domain-containing protein [Archaeoglobus sp.]|uniref:DUF2589 domain-containing protein n=1 Tax=Archaeoglobus sp. TaxID=1872626 RepID=UPI001DF9D95A|nr:DUF2589 domain-containing protein [Archaeoglobus sp.]MBO8180108.1 DUF2589 domain-containing protein [Archaeoglobus sp.]